MKVGIGAAIYALPSFIASTRPFYSHWRGEWGLLSYMLVCSQHVGSSNTTSFARFIGTAIGAVAAIAGWTMTQGNVFAVAAFGWAMSLWTSYIILALGKGPMGRFVLLTYNLSALYAYSLSVKDAHHDEDEGGIDPVITTITKHRVVAVLSGCLCTSYCPTMLLLLSSSSTIPFGILLTGQGVSSLHDSSFLSVLAKS